MNNNTLDLLKLVRLGDEVAKEQVVSDNLGLVWSIVHRFRNNYYDKEDLFQIGCIGLMKAINNFDDAYNVQFSTYAVPIIMGEIKRYFRDDGTIKVSRSLKELNIKVTKAKEILQGENNKEPTIDDIAKYLNVSQNTYSQYETGVISLTAEVLIKLADYYNVSIDFLLDRTNDPTTK